MNSLLDWFIRRHLPLDDETLTRARISVGLLLFNVVMLVVAAISLSSYIWLGTYYNRQFTLQLVLALAPTLLLYSLSLWHFARTLSFSIAGSLFLLSQWLVLGVAVLLTGGVRASPITPLLVIVAQYAFLLIGLRGGLLWSGIVLASLAGLMIADFAGITFGTAANAPLMRAYEMMAPLLLLVISTAALLFYEYMTRKLRTDLAAERNQLAWQAIHDPLTGLVNREEFNRSLQRAIAQAGSRRHHCAVIYIDLDNFKPINDRYGHLAGDHVLCEVASRLRQCVRESDTVARLGGDEFAVIMPALLDATHAMMLAAQIHRALVAPIAHGSDALLIGASIGIATYPEHAVTAKDLLHHADTAMYDAKQAQRTRTSRR